MNVSPAHKSHTPDGNFKGHTDQIMIPVDPTNLFPPASYNNGTSIKDEAGKTINGKHPTPSPSSIIQLNGGEHHASAGHSQQHGAHKLTRVKSLETCRVCGDGPARMHYGVPTCFGCKGFFRRTFKRTKEYTCRYSGNCIVDRYERNSCRFCRFKRCLEVGMDPKAVRPDRDAAGRTHPIRHRRSRTSLGDLAVLGEQHEGETGESDDWIRKLPVDMRTLLMQIMNTELLVSNGDSLENPKKLYPLPFDSLRQILMDPTLLEGKRTEMRYEPYRQVEPDELVPIAHRRLIAVIDMVDHLCVLMDLHNIEDKIALVKSAYAPLSVFCAVAATARITKDRNLLCLCSFGYVPRGAQEELYHFANRLVDRTLDELVEPFRAFNFKEQEVVLMKAIVTLNPHIRSLTTEAAEQVADLRDRIQETLYNVVRESHPKEMASSRFGNLLLFLPNVMLLGNVMYENLQFIQSFGKQIVDPLLSELLDNHATMPMQQDLNGVNLEDVLSLSDHSDEYCSSSSTNDNNYINRSQSSSSIASSVNSNNEYGQREGIATTSYSSSSYDYFNRNGNANNNDAFNCQHQQQHQHYQSHPQLSSNDSDPDYNVTLTADNAGFMSGMSQARQAIVQSMEIDSEQYNPSQQQQKPVFFIDSNGSGMPLGSQYNHQNSNNNNRCGIVVGQLNSNSCPYLPPTHRNTTMGSRHVFTIESIEPPAPNNLGSRNSDYTRPHDSTIFQKQQQQHPQDEDVIGLEGNNGGVSSSIPKSQSFPYATTSSINQQQQHQQMQQSQNFFASSQPHQQMQQQLNGGGLPHPFHQSYDHQYPHPSNQ